MPDRRNFPEFPNYYRSLSLRLCQVLDDLGASTALRDEDVKARTTEEILVTFTDWLDEEEGKLIEGKAAFYHVGSYFERTTIPGLKSDRDLLIVEDRHPVVTDVSDAQPYYDCLLMIQDSSTPPGYSKLQFVVNGTPRFVFFSSEQVLGWHRDEKGRAVLVPRFGNVIRGSVSHGPAETVEATQNTRAADYVDALRCRTVPDCASEWFTRQRPYNWPTTDCIDKCKTLGCFFVHVGHPYSEECCLEWRLSFSLQERLLVTSFNSAQLKIFVLLKIIKKEIIKPALVKDTLTSYHCKTCMFYMIENTPAEFWREDNLLICLYSCLNMIKTWVETGVCPNYFVPDENMFDGKIFGRIRIRLHEILSSFLAADFRYLVELKTDDIGQRFQEAIVSEEHCDRNLQETMAVNHKYISHVKCILRQRLLILHWSQRGQQTLSVTCKRLSNLTSELERIETITEHEHEETSYALLLLLPYVQISFMSVLTVLAKQLHRSMEYVFELLTSEKRHTVCLESDSFSSKLKQASGLYMLGFHDLSLDILLNLEVKLRNQLGICCCSGDRGTRLTLEEYLSINVSSIKEFLGFIVSCVVYLPAESDLMPRALSYELGGFIETLPDGSKQCYKLATFDGKILLYFLLYLNHRHFNMEANAAADVNNIRWLIRTDRHLGHREVAFNILGWIYKERGLVRRAIDCFQESIKQQPEQNAAFQHMRDLDNSFNGLFETTGI